MPKTKKGRHLMMLTLLRNYSVFAELKLHYKKALKPLWCPGPESNRHALRRGILSPLRLPISPPGQTAFEPADWEAEKSRRQPASQRLCRKSFPRASPCMPAADNRAHWSTHWLKYVNWPFLMMPITLAR